MVNPKILNSVMESQPQIIDFCIIRTRGAWVAHLRMTVYNFRGEVVFSPTAINESLMDQQFNKSVHGEVKTNIKENKRMQKINGNYHLNQK